MRLPTFEDSFLFYQFSSPTEDPGFSNRISEQFDGEPRELLFPSVEENRLEIPSNMWWADLKAAVGQRINVEGLTEYDHDDSKAKALEAEIGIRVLRHRVKKPAGTAEEVEKHFGCASSELIMVGDRPFTDIVFGNRNRFLIILTEPLSRAEEPFIVRQVRRLELALLKRWLRKGLKPVDHSLVSDVTQFVKDPSDL